MFDEATVDCFCLVIVVALALICLSFLWTRRLFVSMTNIAYDAPQIIGFEIQHLLVLYHKMRNRDGPKKRE